jgi:hypothetical protein
LGAAAIEFGVNAGEMGPGDMMVGWGGPAQQVALNCGNGDVDTNGASCQRGWGCKVEADVKGVFSRVFGEPTGRLTLNIVFGLDKAG